MLPEVLNTELFRLLAHISNGELIWHILINNMGHDDPQPCDYYPEWDGEIPKFQPPPPELSPETSPSPLKRHLHLL